MVRRSRAPHAARPIAAHDGLAEGLYIRGEAEGRLVARAKLVRPEFVQAIGQHGSRKALSVNTLAEGAGPPSLVR